MELEIVKVEEGLCEGQVLFHKYQQRSAAEAAAQQGEWEEKAALREERRKQQVRVEMWCGGAGPGPAG
jgi:ribosome biogenesis protein SSF1/2